ncbi:MAG: CCA tRNA nucleotidyltransferase [Chloroflexota bacterium]|nr:CCA tRNA nucleotidyltransferase [Chloroflexota bacterium]
MSLLQKLQPHVLEVLEALERAFDADGAALALVGGPVRDLLLERQVDDAELDLTTDATPDRIRRLGEAAGARSTFDIGERFGTIGLVFDAGGDRQLVAEITTYRAEVYPDESRHPEVTFGDSLEDDLSRRDFTINAMAIDLGEGELIDPFDGVIDLHQARIRAVGDPVARFRDDPLRLLRAARFVGQLGFFVDPATRDAMAEVAPELRRISRERIYAELTKLLTGEFASHGLEVLLDTGLFETAMPELAPLAAEAEKERTIHREKDLWEHTLRVVDKAPRRPIVRWAALLHDAAKPHTRSVSLDGDVHFFGHERVGADLAEELLRRLGADKRTVETVSKLVELHLRPAAYDVDWTDSAVRRLMLDAGDCLQDLLDLTASDITSANERKVKQARRLMDSLRRQIARIEEETALAELKSPLDGDELMRLFGQPPGRWIADVKDHLRELVIDGELGVADKERALELASEFLNLPVVEPARE